MPSLFSSSRSVIALFDIRFVELRDIKFGSSATNLRCRLENDFLVYRGGDQESAGQYLKGSVIVCANGPIKIEDVHLRLTALQRLAYVPLSARTVGSLLASKTYTVIGGPTPDSQQRGFRARK